MDARTTSRLEKDGRRGATLAVTVILLLGVLAVLALAIDLGMLFTARNEAQRAADAGALAGASAFIELEPDAAVPLAEMRADSLAELNYIRKTSITGDEVAVEVVPDERLVRVTVRRDSIPTWFARILGIRFVPVSAVAAARAEPGGSARCLKPFAIPDIWNDADQDTNGNRLWDPGEEWRFDAAAGDHYLPYSGPDGAWDETGYGSTWRDASDAPPIGADFGRQITVKLTDPSSESSLAPGWFFPWRLPEDPDIEACSHGGSGGGSTGGAVYRRNICSCNNYVVELGVPYDVEPGDMRGPTRQGVEDLINQDPDAYWDAYADGGKGAVGGSSYSDWRDSPRVVKVGMFDPTVDMASGMHTITFNNFGLFFVEAQGSGADAPVVGRFLWYVDGDGEATGGTTGSLVLFIRLVE